MRWFLGVTLGATGMSFFASAIREDVPLLLGPTAALSWVGLALLLRVDP